LIFSGKLLSFRDVSVAQAQTTLPRELRSLLILGRVSNLPTVWSNCLAGWLLSGGGGAIRFVLLCLGASFIYVGGMFLNDAFDAEFDRQHRQERPIPSGAISPAKVWGWGLGWLAGGLLLLSLLGKGVFGVTLILCACVITYDAIHKAVTMSPVLMALCRLLLYLLAAAAGTKGITGLPIWTGLALASYVVGLSYIARKESARGPVASWPCWALLTPFLMAMVTNAGSLRTRALIISALLALWIVRCLGHTFGASTISVGRTVSGLLAGICLVDLLAVNPGSGWTVLAFLSLFAAALLGQRYVPAT
jgi:4-hydroxybenzoate polyprenyltransferase